MRGQVFVKSRNAQRFRSRGIASVILYVSFAAGIAWLSPAPAFAQAVPSTAQPSVGMPVTSSLDTGSTRPAGVPLGSTEIATPGISPIAPSQSTGMGNCAGPDSAQSAPFDGGGLSGTTPLSCADSQTLSSPLPSPSSVGRVGIPLGATELGSAGISQVAPVAGPSLSITNPGNP
jgi:hypothetical protein